MRYLSLFALALLSSCVTVPNVTACAVNGKMLAGALCAGTNTGITSEMNLDELLTFIEPTDKRGGAILMSAEDWNKMKTALEQACREIGNGCKYEK